VPVHKIRIFLARKKESQHTQAHTHTPEQRKTSHRYRHFVHFSLSRPPFSRQPEPLQCPTLNHLHLKSSDSSTTFESPAAKKRETLRASGIGWIRNKDLARYQAGNLTAACQPTLIAPFVSQPIARTFCRHRICCPRRGGRIVRRLIRAGSDGRSRDCGSGAWCVRAHLRWRVCVCLFELAGANGLFSVQVCARALICVVRANNDFACHRSPGHGVSSPS
jgi:hypothetical protein